MITTVRDINDNLEEWQRNNSSIPGHWAFRIYNRGIKLEVIENLAAVYGLEVDKAGFQIALTGSRQRDMRNTQRKTDMAQEDSNEKVVKILSASDMPATDDSAKYVYEVTDGHYNFPPVKTEVLMLIQDKTQLAKVTKGTVGIVLKATNFYHEAGGQEGDQGTICTSNANVINITSVDNIGGYIVHWGTLDEGEIAVGDDVTTAICSTRRFKCMQHHTATHLLNCAINYITGKLVGFI